MHPANSEVHRLATAVFRGDGGGKRRGLLRAFEAGLAGRAPGKRVASVMVISRLLNVAEMWAIPSDSTTFLPRLTLARAGAGAAGAPDAAGSGAGG
jgi:hypothetical protein